jgi:hypothetical protein
VCSRCQGGLYITPQPDQTLLYAATYSPSAKGILRKLSGPRHKFVRGSPPCSLGSPLFGATGVGRRPLPTVHPMSLPAKLAREGLAEPSYGVSSSSIGLIGRGHRYPVTNFCRGPLSD